MVSFSCDNCGEVVKKPKVQNHIAGCRPRFVSCIDCSKQFTRDTVHAHSSCISEAEKYQGALYRGKKQQDKGQQQQAKPAATTPAKGAAAPNGTAPATPASSAKPAAAKPASDAEPAGKKRKLAAEDNAVTEATNGHAEPAKLEEPAKKKKKSKEEPSVPEPAETVPITSNGAAAGTDFVFQPDLKVEKRLKQSLKKGAVSLDAFVETLVQRALPSLTEQLKEHVTNVLKQSTKFTVDDELNIARA